MGSLVSRRIDELFDSQCGRERSMFLSEPIPAVPSARSSFGLVSNISIGRVGDSLERLCPCILEVPLRGRNDDQADGERANPRRVDGSTDRERPLAPYSDRFHRRDP